MRMIETVQSDLSGKRTIGSPLLTLAPTLALALTLALTLTLTLALA